MFKPSDCKDIWTRKYEFVAKTLSKLLTVNVE